MDREPSPKPPLCLGGCGFYGNTATEGLCSLCYKKSLKQKQDSLVRNSAATRSKSQLVSNCLTLAASDNEKSNVTGEEPKIELNTNSNNSEPEPAALPSTSEPTTRLSSESIPEENKVKKNRCAVCNKKVGLTGITCRCGGLFCPIHRYSDKHNCTFDYRELGAEEIRRNNPEVVAEKIRKI